MVNHQPFENLILPIDVQQYRIAEFLSILQNYSSEESIMCFLSAFSSLRTSDLLRASLTLMNFDDWVVNPLLVNCYLAHSF